MKKSEKHPLAIPVESAQNVEVEQGPFHEAMMDVTPLTPHGRFISTRPQPSPLPLFHAMDERQRIAAMSDPVDWGEEETEADASFVKPGF